MRNHAISVVTVVVTLLVIWVIYSKLNSKGQLTAAKWEPFVSANLWKTYILPGVQGTLTAAAVSIVLALLLGFVLGVGRMSAHNAIRWTCSVIVEFFRAVPVLIMMIFAYFLYAAYDVFPSKHLALAGVITGLTLYNGAVIAEIVRAGVNALPRGQGEAASSLGLGWGQTMRSILLPQAITSMLPVLISQLVVVLKDTAIGYQITFLEMVRQGTQVGSAYGNYIPALIVIAVLMIAVNFALSQFAVWLEGRMRRSRKGPAPMHVEAARHAGHVRRRRRRHDLARDALGTILELSGRRRLIERQHRMPAADGLQSRKRGQLFVQVPLVGGLDEQLNRTRDLGGIPADLGTCLVEVGAGLCPLVDVAMAGHIPLVGVAGDDPQHLRLLSPDDDRRMRPL